jgi:hypothetical protein
MGEGSNNGRLSADELRGWVGHRLDDISGEDVGKCAGVFVDESSGAPEWLLVRMGRFGNHTLIPARDAVEGVGRVWVPYARDQIQAAPKIDPKRSLAVAGERELLAHYAIAVDGGRAADLADRDDDAVSARALS